MALFRKFFYKKPPDGLLEITERVYVFDYCFTTDVMDEDEYKVYIGGIIRQLRDHFPDASLMVFNMREGENQSQISNILCDYDMTVMDYPRQYEGCPLLTMEMIHHFLRSGESWLQLGQQNIVLMHCERGGWPVLAFMLAAFLIYRKLFTGEQKTLDMIYKQAPRELLQLMSPLNPLPSQFRYLQYISRRNVGSEWPPLDRALTLDCVIIRLIPNMDGNGGCRPIFRIYGQDPFIPADRTPKVLFSTPKRSKLVRHYKQDECELVKIDIHCHVQGDVVLECISLDSDLEREQMMFRVMFNTAFIRSNILMLNRDEIDMLWNAKDQFPKNFRVEVLFSEMEASSSVISIDLPRIEEKEGLPVEAFAKVKEIFSNVDWLDSKTEVASMLQQITASNILLEKLDSGVSSPTSSLLKESLSGRFKFDSKTQNDTMNLPSAIQKNLSESSLELSRDAPMEKKIQPLESKALSENDNKTLASLSQGDQPIPTSGLSRDSGSAKKENESLESKQSFENDTKFPTSMVQEKQSIPLIEPSIDPNSVKKKIGSLEYEEKDIVPLASKAMLENDTVFPASESQGKQSTHLLEQSNNASSIKNKIGQLGSKETEIGSLGSEALLQSDKELNSELKTLPEIDVGSPISAVQSKLPQFSIESSRDATKEKNKEPSESKASPENNIKTLAPTGQGKQHIPTSGLSTDSNSSKMQIESLESKTSVENDTKCPPSIAQEKQSIPLIQPSTDVNSMKKMNGQSESVVLSESDTKRPTPTVQRKQNSPLLESSTDAIKKKFEPKELQVSLKLPTQSKIISPRLHQANRSAPASYSNSLQGSPVAISRYHSAPSALGITSVLQDHTPTDIKEVTHAMTVSPASTLPPSDSKESKSIEPSSTSVCPASSPALLPSLPVKSSGDALASVEKTFKPLASAPPSKCEPNSELAQSVVTKHSENKMDDNGQKSLVMPPPLPPPALPFDAIQSSLSMPTPPTPALSSPSSAMKSSHLSHPPPSPLPETSPSTGKDTFKGPPTPPPPPPPSFSGQNSSLTPPLPPYPTGQTSSSSIPLPPPSPSSTRQTSSSSIPPPPPPAPSSTGKTSSSSIPPPPPPSMSGPPPPPPPPRHSGTTPGSTPTSIVSPPPPPPPPASASQNSLSRNPTNPPPVPPPPAAPANGLSKSGAPPLQLHTGAGNGNVPPIPGPPSGALFGAKGRGLLRPNPKIQTQTKRNNLKPYHWLKLTRAMQGSLWAETQKLDEASRAPEFDMSELETYFAAVAPNSEKGGKSNRRVSGQKADKVQLIELRRAYNCEIMLTKVKIPLPDLMSAVLALDDSILQVDQVENLIKFCPTKEEIEMLKNYKGDTDNLGKCEQFFLELMKVPRVENKLRVFSFKMQFCTQVADLRRDLSIVNSTSEEIRNSVKLKRIMQTILSLGNALNHGTARGSAVGFRLDSLLKLTDTRARNNKMTLMHYLCKVLADKLPELLDFPKDLVSLEASTKIQLKYLAEEMTAIDKGLEKVVQELTASENDGPVSDNFCQVQHIADSEGIPSRCRS
ncbi:formin-like protein 18 isoform X2 [Lotus japonicus]|uniref:formin-like protein 18 isoform X2 n=1 Tax=Lotus japonicus TaxID=34305 RepID=UPI00258CABE5|nr:formin-like protein 18 isoform X2 [Lotus japonicus]